MNHVCVEHRDIGPVPAGTSFCVDGPAHGSVHPGWVFMHGWVVPPIGSGRVQRVVVEHDGCEIATLPCGQPRPDVEAALSPQDARGCGFSGDVDLAHLAALDRSSNDICIRAIWEGATAIIGARTITPTSAPTSATGDHSQSGEVSVVRSLVTAEFPRLVVDVGAHDGWTLSNSYPFIASGWRGVLIEPLPTVFELLAANHRRHGHASVVNAACSDHDGEASLFIGHDGDFGMKSTLSVDDNEWMRSTRSDRAITVEVRRLSSILADIGVTGDIGLLLVDCEGMDFEALSGLDPTVNRPWVVVTEQYPSNPVKEVNKRALLESWGMVLHRTVGPNDIWAQAFLLGN